MISAAQAIVHQPLTDARLAPQATEEWRMKSHLPVIWSVGFCVEMHFRNSVLFSVYVKIRNLNRISNSHKESFEFLMVFKHFILKVCLPIFRSIKEDAVSPRNVSELQNVSLQENSSENCNSSKVIMGNDPCGKHSHNFPKTCRTCTLVKHLDWLFS